MKRKVLALLLTVLMVVPAVSMASSAITRNTWQDFSSDGSFIQVPANTPTDVNGLYTVTTNDVNGVYALFDVNGQLTTVDAAYAAGAAGSDGDHYTTITTNYKVALNGFNANFKNYAAQPYGAYPAFTQLNLMTPTLSFAWTTSPILGGYSGRGLDVGDAEAGQQMGFLSWRYHVGDTNPLIDNGVVLNFSTRTGSYYQATDDGQYYWNFGSGTGAASGNPITYAFWADFAVIEDHVVVYQESKGDAQTGPCYIYTQDDRDFTTNEDDKNKNMTLSLSGNSLTVVVDEYYKGDKFNYTYTNESIARLSPYRDYYFSMMGVSDGRGVSSYNQYKWGGVNFGIADVWGRDANVAKASGTKYMDTYEDLMKNNDANAATILGATDPALSFSEGRSAVRVAYTAKEDLCLGGSIAALEEYIGISHQAGIGGIAATVRKGQSNGTYSPTTGAVSANTAAAVVFRDGVQEGKVLSVENGVVTFSVFLYNIANKDQKYRFRESCWVTDLADPSYGYTARYNKFVDVSYNDVAGA